MCVDTVEILYKNISIKSKRLIVGEFTSRETIGPETFLLKRRSKYVYHDDYPFKMDRKRNHKEYYHCVQNVSLQCKARLVIKTDTEQSQITQIKQHNHADKKGA